MLVTELTGVAGDVVAPLQGQQVSTHGLADALAGGLGHLTRVYGTNPVEPDERAAWLWDVQRELVRNTRLGIPAIVHEECLTGLAAWKAATFPSPPAWGATFAPELVERMAGLIGEFGKRAQDGKLAMEGQAIKVTTGPSAVYWNPKNVAQGNYTVKATFTEPEYMNINSHPHPYGIFIGGNDMGGASQSLLYCAAYGNGSFIFRGFSATAPRGTFQMNGPRGEVNAAVNKAAGKDQPVKQEISVSVKGDNVTCSINGTVVGTYPKASLIGEGKLTSLDGFAGVRFAHNTDAHVAGWMVMK